MVLTLVLLASAGLLTQSFLLLHRVAPGFDPNNVLTARIGLPDATYSKPEQTATFYKEVQDRIGRLPGVETVSSCWWLPLSGSEVTFDTEFEGRPLPAAQLPVVQVNAIGTNYFKALRVPLRSGRDFMAQDDIDAPPVAIVTESFARRFFPGEDAVGKRIKPHGSVKPGDPPFRQIVGVVGDMHFLSLNAEPKPAVYVPHTQFPVQGMSLVVRTAGDPNSLANSVQRAVNELDKDVPVFRLRSLSDYVDRSVAQPRFHAILVSLFSAVALLLAAGGIFGVMSYAVSQRTQEIGIRLALGAQRLDVQRLVIGEGMRLVGLGVCLGLLAVFVCSRLLRGLLYGVGPTHFPTLVAVATLLSLVALAACWWPAHRASNVDPVVALREG